MKLSGIHHVSVCVTDEQEALHFYRDQLGLTVLPRPDFGFGGYWLDAGVQQVHLMQSDTVPKGGHHFAFLVEDMQETLADLRSHGVKVDEVPHMKGAGYQAFLHDPSGNLIELNQPDGLAPAE